MCRNVDLFINIQQSFKDNSNSTDIFVTGKLKKRKRCWILEYENEYNGVSKIVLYENFNVKIISDGDISYNLSLEINRPTTFNFQGKDAFSYFSVIATKIYYEIDETGGFVKIEYGMDVEGKKPELITKLDILVKTTKRKEV